jgi:hypothetical protein
MTTARELFAFHLDRPEADDELAELRRSLARAKLETLDQVDGLDQAGLRLVMPGLYEQIVASTVRIAARVGLAVGLALEVMDEYLSGCSISSFSREVRQEMTATGVELKRRHASRLAVLAAEIEAQRLAWRHSHEFLSWLAFRRGDETYPAADRREHLSAFKVESRLLQSRETVAGLLGWPMAVALEGHDRFMLAHRWRIGDAPEEGVERQVWPLLAFQTRETTALEIARYELDVRVGARDAGAERHALAHAIAQLLRQQLEKALDAVPTAIAVPGL